MDTKSYDLSLSFSFRGRNLRLSLRYCDRNLYLNHICNLLLYYSYVVNILMLSYFYSHFELFGRTGDRCSNPTSTPLPSWTTLFSTTKKLYVRCIANNINAKTTQDMF